MFLHLVTCVRNFRALHCHCCLTMRCHLLWTLELAMNQLSLWTEKVDREEFLLCWVCIVFWLAAINLKSVLATLALKFSKCYSCWVGHKILFSIGWSSYFGVLMLYLIRSSVPSHLRCHKCFLWLFSDFD